MKASYCDCACRDCFDIAIGDDDLGLALCWRCNRAGCDDCGETECLRDDAYETEPLELPGEWRPFGGEPREGD